MRKSLTLLVAVVALATILLSTAPTSGSTPIASNDALYQVCGRVFPDPHAYWPAPTQAPGRSPYAKGNAGCGAFDFLQYQEMVDGVAYLKELLPQFITFYKLNEDFGTRSLCRLSISAQDMCSAGLPKAGAPNSRAKEELYMLRVSNGASNDGKKLFAFPLSIHGIERAGAEAGVRAAEDLATWAYCEAVQAGELEANGRTNCAQEGQIPHPLLEADPDADSVTAGEALKKTAIYFVFANADGWRRGDRDNGIRYFQRYNGNGVDLNRDWPAVGFTFLPYTPWSEPESRSFGNVLKSIRKKWDGGIDLHGQLIDRAFSFTLLGQGQKDFAKNQRMLQAARGAWADAEARLAWSPLIKPNDASPDDQRLYGVQWGTVWDTIDYTVTGAFGDWIESPLGLNADGLDNEMSLSHLSNCGAGSCYLIDPEQLHVDGNKSLVYAMVNFTLLPEDTKFRLPGKVAYVNDPTVIANHGQPIGEPGYRKLLPQAPILDVQLSPANDYMYEFDVLGPDQNVFNGGLEAKMTASNVGGVGNDGVGSFVLERRLGPDEEPEPNSRCDGSAGWLEVNRYFAQGVGYFAAGSAVHSNFPQPGRWRVCLLDSTELTAGVADVDITFSREQAWPDPGQLKYRVTSMNFFNSLRKFAGKKKLVPVSAAQTSTGSVDLSQYDSLVIADNPAPGIANLAAWGAKLRAFVESGGNLVLTDGALQNLEHMGIVAAGKVRKNSVYAGFIAFTRDNGSTTTYSDPLAADVNQPGAAEGSGHRHQTYEPVPIGYSIQTPGGDDLNTAPAWTVEQAAWEAAGGRTVGQTGNGRASLGELSLGNGVVRIIGSLVPMPTEQYYHPFGLADHAVTYTGYQVLANALQWTRP